MKLRYIPTLALVAILTACGGDDAPSTSASAPAAKPAPTPVKAQLTPLERGAKLYKRCQACHTLNEGGKHKVGPNLWAVYGAKAGSKEGYAYSKAMLASGITWDNDSMDAYMAKPKDFIPGNKMSFVGIRKAEDRAALQAYMIEQTTPAN